MNNNSYNIDKSISKKVADLYLSGLSVNQISDSIKVSPSKIRYSLEKQSIPRRSHSSASRMLYITKFNKKQCVLKENFSSEEEKLRIAGVMLYWGEGTKSGNSVAFSNSDPDMIMLFLRFLRTICGIHENRLRILMHLYSDQNEIEMKCFWSEITGIPQNQFSKTYFHEKKRGTYKKTSCYGTISLRYSDKELLSVIINWLNTYKIARVAQR